jgi:hypothetical protein
MEYDKDRAHTSAHGARVSGTEMQGKDILFTQDASRKDAKTPLVTIEQFGPARDGSFSRAEPDSSTPNI